MLIYVLTPLLFLFQLLVCESIFLASTKRRRPFMPRLFLSLLGYGGAALCVNYAFSLLPQTIPVRILFFLVFFSGSVVLVRICYELHMPQAIFVAIAGYSVQHIADSLVKITMELVDITSSLPVLIAMLTLPYAGCAALFYFLFVKKALLADSMQYSDRRVLIVSAANLVLCLVLSVVMDQVGMAMYGTIIGKIYAIMGCVLCLTLQAGFFQSSKIEQDNRTLQQMMEMERRQHRISKKNIELINMKCHDLKHQIGRLEHLSDEKREKSIAELSQAILIYDSMLKTGSEALDLVLMEKKLQCDKHHIRFSFVGEASGLQRMDEVDVYSLFGNMLDNAIESLQQEPDEEKRIITLNIHNHMRMLYICMDNYCGTPVIYKDGELQTTKQHEPGMHGYGVKSIAYIVNAYKGDLMITTENNHFVLEIMLPDEGKAETPPGEME